MQVEDVALAAAPGMSLDAHAYNYEHFRPRHVLAEILGVSRLHGIAPGAPAPDFDLPDSDGRPWRLSAHRGRPVLLHFGPTPDRSTSARSRPWTRLHERWGDRVNMATVLVRQGHPGPAVPAYRRLDAKAADARAHREEDGVGWPVLVDDLDGRVHKVYGYLADPTFVIDVDGRVAFYNAVTHAPTLTRALDALAAQGGRGVVLGGHDRTPHLLHVIAAGWPALRRGLWQSALDLETSVPGSALR